MKIIYLDSVNDALARIYVLLKETIADAYIITGNIINNPYYSRERFDSLLNDISGYCSDTEETSGSNMPFSEQLGKIQASNIRTDETEQLLKNINKAKESIQHKYKTLGNILSSKPYTPTCIVPGYKDVFLADYLKDRFFHNLSMSIEDQVISGFSECEQVQVDFLERFTCEISPANEQESNGRMLTLIEESRPVILALSRLPVKNIITAFPSLSGENDSAGYPKLIAGRKIDEEPGISITNDRLFLNPLSFGEEASSAGTTFEGGFFYEITCDKNEVIDIKLKKLVGDRVYDIAGYLNRSGKLSETVIDKHRLEAARQLRNYESKDGTYAFTREVRAFRDIRNFFRLHQTEETEKRVEDMLRALALMEEPYTETAIDMVGSSNIGLSQKSSDIDMVLYIRGGLDCVDDTFECTRYRETEEMLRKHFVPDYGFEIIDYVNLDLVEASIRTRDLDCPVTQRFVIYRSMCRPVNYKLIAPVEDLLNSDTVFRKEMEEQMREYFSILFTTPDTEESFEKYQLRLRSMDISIPEPIARKIKMLVGK